MKYTITFDKAALEHLVNKEAKGQIKEGRVTNVKVFVDDEDGVRATVEVDTGEGE